MRRIRSILMILLALWLPLQAVAAWAMPFCAHAAAAVSEDAQAMPAHCHHEAEAAPASTAAGFDCDNCGMCHLASAGYLFASAQPLAISPAAAKPLFPPLMSHRSYIGDPPQHPPRSFS